MATIVQLPSIDIAYESHGDDDVAVLLIQGLGFQLTDWDAAFVHRFVAAGYRVVVFDNRDVGESTHLTGKVALGELRRAVERGERHEVPYLIGDMAEDTAALLAHLGIAAAHVVGVSMGGYIAQELALRHPTRVLSLVSMMSSTGSREVGQPNVEGERALFRAPAADRSAAIDDMIDARRILATPGEFDEQSERARVQAAVDRSYDPAGTGRQLAAIWASGDRTPQLHRLDVPTLVVHGTGDHLVGVSGGVATAEAIPGARLVVIDGMGHDLPPRHWGRILGDVLGHLDAAQPPASDLRILPARPEESPHYAELCRRAFAEDAALYGGGPPGITDPVVHRELLDRGHCHVAVVDGETVGGLYMFPSGDGEWRLGPIFVDPAWHRRGIGSELLEFAPLGHPGLRRITLETPYRNDYLHRFYESHGYRKIGETDPARHVEQVTDPEFRLYEYEQAFS